jgi:hypothetical protein
MPVGLFGTVSVVAGFTGNQDGMTKQQKRTFRKLLIENGVTELHHGDCIGSDADAHLIAKTMGLSIVKHPPVDDKKRAYCKGGRELPAKPYLPRNKDIVKASSIMFATPRSFNEVVRSGTWSTVRFAVDKKVKMLVIYPDGSVVDRKKNPELSTLEDNEEWSQAK